MLPPLRLMGAGYGYAGQGAVGLLDGVGEVEGTGSAAGGVVGGEGGGVVAVADGQPGRSAGGVHRYIFAVTDGYGDGFADAVGGRAAVGWRRRDGYAADGCLFGYGDLHRLGVGVAVGIGYRQVELEDEVGGDGRRRRKGGHFGAGGGAAGPGYRVGRQCIAGLGPGVG